MHYSRPLLLVLRLLKYAAIKELKVPIETRYCSVFRAAVRAIAQVGAGIGGLGLLWRTGRY